MIFIPRFYYEILLYPYYGTVAKRSPKIYNGEYWRYKFILALISDIPIIPQILFSGKLKNYLILAKFITNFSKIKPADSQLANGPG